MPRSVLKGIHEVGRLAGGKGSSKKERESVSLLLKKKVSKCTRFFGTVVFSRRFTGAHSR
jgi:hypothetical protein